MPYSLRLFGTIEIRDPSGNTCAEVLSQPKRAALLAYLAAARPSGFQRRDKLLAVFWPASDLQSARRSLNQSIHFLRHTMIADCLPSRGADEIGLNREVIECDTVRFQRAIAGERWHEALTLYRGDLLDGFFVSDLPEFEQWLEGVRAAYRDDTVRAAWAVSHAAFANGERGEAKRWAQWAIAQTPYDEGAFRRYLELLSRTGDRATAVKAYTKFASRLDDDLGISPSWETAALAEAIRDGTVAVTEHGDHAPIERAEVVHHAQPESAVPVPADGSHVMQPPNSIGQRVVTRRIPGKSVVLATELWSRIALTGAGAAVALGAAYLAMLELGLPTWVFAGSATLVIVGLLVLAATALLERRRATVIQADVAGGDFLDLLNWRRAFRIGALRSGSGSETALLPYNGNRGTREPSSPPCG